METVMAAGVVWCILTLNWQITVRDCYYSTVSCTSLLRPTATLGLITVGFWRTTQELYGRRACSAQPRTGQPLAFGCRVPVWPRTLLIPAGCSWLRVTE